MLPMFGPLTSDRLDFGAGSTKSSGNLAGIAGRPGTSG
jgi:hypothetical protein